MPFTDIGGAVLRMLAATRGITISDADSAELTDRFASMPPHPEVPAALRRLRDHGFRLFTLTDNTLEISGRQLEDRRPADRPVRHGGRRQSIGSLTPVAGYAAAFSMITWRSVARCTPVTRSPALAASAA